MWTRHTLVLSLIIFSSDLARADKLSLDLFVPTGWVDVSQGAPEKNFADLPDELIKQLKGGQFIFAAMDLDHLEEGFAANVNAQHSECIGRFTKSITTKLADNIVADLVAKEIDAELVSEEVVEIDDADVARIVTQQKRGKRTIRQVHYFIAGVKDCIVLTYTCLAKQFARYEPIFDRAAKKTRGAYNLPTRRESIFKKAMQHGVKEALIVLGGILLGVIVAAVIRKRQRKR